MYGFLAKVMVFVVSTTKVLAVINVRFTIRILVICTTPAAATRLHLGRSIVFWMVMAATLNLFASGRHREVGIVLCHPGLRWVVVV